MKTSKLAVLAALTLLALPAQSVAQDLDSGNSGERLVNIGEIRDRKAVGSKLRTSGTADDTVYVGHVASAGGTGLPGTPGGHGPYKIGRGPYRPGVSKDGVWSWDGDAFQPSENDSLMGWWPYRQLYNVTGGTTLADTQRPWWAFDAGNSVNYVLNSRQQNRTFGVNGVWHVDPGNVMGATIPGTNPLAPAWTPITGSGSAWCGLRGHGDLTAMDLASEGGYGNPFNGDAHLFMHPGGGTGSTKNWPGYASQWDQMLYRDIVVPDGADLTIAFDYATAMSTSATSTAATQTGWFDWDPRIVAAGNFISATSAGVNRPVDSMMVYIGQPVDVNACRYSDGLIEPVYDLKRRWKSEVLKIDATKEILSRAGNNATTHVEQTIAAADLAPYRDAAGRVRLCFRVKTNRGFDDTGAGYSSGRAGAARIDNVVLDHSGSPGAEITSGFESASEIDNTPEASGYAVNAWKSTGKPPGIYSHVHPLDGGDIGGGNVYAPLTYEDLCGPPDAPSRFCNINGVVISVGDHDNDEAAGGVSETFMPAERELIEGIVSPAINLRSTGPGDFNAMGIDTEIADVTDDYYIFYDMYTGVFDLFFEGNSWQFSFMCYPVLQSNGSRAWSEPRYSVNIFNPEEQCFTDFEPGRAFGLIQTSNPSGIPDSLRILLVKIQQCFRFAITTGCSSTDGTYFDNVSLGLIDFPENQQRASAASAVGTISVDYWQWINDAFPNNETAGLPGTAAFDTCGANLMTGANQAQVTGTLGRFDLPGDSIRVTGTGAGMRMDMVFRILPGVGNYTTIGDRNTLLRQVPTSLTAATPGDGSFFGQYLGSNDGGGFGTPGGHPGGVWSQHVWNSARCDTVETNYFRIASRFVGGPTIGGWQNTYHESDLKYPILGIPKNICFLVDTAGAINAANTTCSSVPAWVTTVPYSGYNGVQTTQEYTKIIPDGLLTPGAHVQYFFRKSELAAPSVFVSTPDTSRIFPQNQGFTDSDGHRFQHFSVLPDRWKDPSFGGQGMACALVVDYNDRRGNERVWVSVADSIGATAQSKWGAHNGWHVFPGYVASDGTQDYTDEIVGGDPTIAVWSHGGQPGTTWDFYQVKGAESLPNQAGALGSRLANRTGMALAAGKFSRQGPTPEMLRTYYRLLFLMSGDLSGGILGPFVNRSQDDITLLTDFLTNPSGSAQPRGIFVMGDGFVQSETQSGGIYPAHLTLLSEYLGVSLRSQSYRGLSGHREDYADLIPTDVITTDEDIYGVASSCAFGNDVLLVNGSIPGATAAAYYQDVGANGPYVASVYAPSSVTRPWVAMTSGWDIEHLHTRYGHNSRGRLMYFFNTFANVFGSLCSMGGAPMLDVPQTARRADFIALGANPVTTGQGRIALGIAERKHVRVQLLDVAGRLVRTLADRSFEPGDHTLIWDGADDGGRRVARGVYFVRVQGLDRGVDGTHKVVFLR